MLAEHGRMGAFPQVRANTVSAFALGDYEWLLAFEADEMTPIVDLMRHLRAAEARRHAPRAPVPHRPPPPAHGSGRRPALTCSAASHWGTLLRVHGARCQVVDAE